MQTSINAADDEEVIRLAAESGCMFVFIGFETISLDSLQRMRKGVNVKTGVGNYRRVVEAFHKYGIGVFGAFIIGNDHETDRYYEELADYLMHSGIDMFQISILTPLPGTELMEQMLDQNRLIYNDFPNDWDKYRFSYMVYEPEETDIEKVYMADNYIKSRLYSFPTLTLRMMKSMINLKCLKKLYTVYRLNKALKLSWENSHYYAKYPKKIS